MKFILVGLILILIQMDVWADSDCIDLFINDADIISQAARNEIERIRTAKYPPRERVRVIAPTVDAIQYRVARAQDKVGKIQAKASQFRERPEDEIPVRPSQTVELNGSSEASPAPIFHALAPKIFSKSFNPKDDGHIRVLQYSDILLKNVDALLRFLAIDLHEIISTFPPTAGMEDLQTVSERAVDAFNSRVRSASPELRQIALQQIIELVKSLPPESPEVAGIFEALKKLNIGSEKVLVAVLEFRKSIMLQLQDQNLRYQAVPTLWDIFNVVQKQLRFMRSTMDVLPRAIDVAPPEMDASTLKLLINEIENDAQILRLFAKEKYLYPLEIIAVFKRKMLSLENIESSYVIAEYFLVENIDYAEIRLFLEKLSRKRGLEQRMRVEISEILASFPSRN